MANLSIMRTLSISMRISVSLDASATRFGYSIVDHARNVSSLDSGMQYSSKVAMRACISSTLSTIWRTSILELAMNSFKAASSASFAGCSANLAKISS